MKGYKVVLPKRDGGKPLSAMGMKIIDEDGNEIKYVLDASANFAVDELMTVTVVLPVSSFTHEGDDQ